MKTERSNHSLKIFVLGYGRSGTTMMGHILGNHPDVYMFRELNFFEKLWDRTHDRTLTASEASDLAAR
ncbi:MAG: sulfotransferase, partial [Candidatus Aminicenantes bacterium]|nr:sulfotransferase [Candidatus Aminicenantes bacterium]